MDTRLLKSTTSGILSYFTRHKTAANLLLVMMIVLGFAASTQIRSQFFPDVIIDNVSVSVKWEGAGPEDIDSAVLALMEPALLSVEGVSESNSYAVEGSARVRLDFEPNWDMARAANDVQEAVDAISGLPEGADDPVVRRGVWRDRVTDVVIYGPVSADQLGRFADEFVGRLFRAGITRASIRGVNASDIEVTVMQSSLIKNDITLGEISAAIKQEATTDPAGEVSGGSARVRTGIAKRSADELAQIVIRSNTDGSKLRVGDVAVVSTRGATENRTYFVGEDQAISIRVDRADKGDAIKMQKAVALVADEMQEFLPEAVNIQLIRTRAQAISDRLNILLDNGLLGLGLVVILLFIFLNARTAFWVAAGIPAAMFAAVGLMYAFGLTLNMVSLFGLIITLGIVVDDAIVVGEHADFRARRLGEKPVEAAENAAIRMALPVFSATITTIIAFYGLTVIGGRFGTLIADIPFTVIAVLAASLLECFIILPHHMSHALTQAKSVKWYDVPSETFNRGFSVFRERVFRPFTQWVLVARYPVIAVAIFLLSTQIAMFNSGKVSWRFFNAPEQSSASGNIAMLPGATRSDTLEMVRELQRATKSVSDRFEEEYGANPVVFAMAEIGGNTGRGLSGTETKDKDQLGAIAIELLGADLRPYSASLFLSELQDEIVRHPLLETLSFRRFRFGPGGDSLDVQFFGANAETLKAAAEALKTETAKFPEVSGLEDTLAYDKEELVLELTPQGQALGFTIDEIGAVLRSRLGGITAVSFPDGVRTLDVKVALPESETGDGFLQSTRLRTSMGEYVALTDVVSVTAKIGFSTITRENGLQVVSVTGEISEDDPARATFISNELREEILPKIAGEFGVDWRQSGLAEQEQSFLSDAMFGFGLCLLGIYLTLTWIFSSWTRPMVVMAIIPFGFIGTIFGHWMHDVPLSIFSVVGIIGMSGIIINDSIVLITTVDEYSKSRGIIPSIIDATTDRLRPVILTSLTTVLGLAPLLFETSRQAQFLKPTVITLVYGLAFGLLLVLIIVPALLVIGQDVRGLTQSYRRGVLGTRIGFQHRIIFIGASMTGLTLLAVTMGYLAVWQTAAPWVVVVSLGFAENWPVVGSLTVLSIGAILVVPISMGLHYLMNKKTI
jgi:multidrug efflux pump subunit AcrB